MILIKIKKIYCYCKEGIKFMRCLEGKEGCASLKPKAKVEQNLKVKCLWLTCYSRLNMTRLVNERLIAFTDESFHLYI